MGECRDEPDRVLYLATRSWFCSPSQSSRLWEAPAPLTRINSFLRCPSRDLGDRRGQDLEVIGSGVGPGAARPQPCCEQFGGVVTPHPDRVKPETVLEGCCRRIFLAVRRHNGGVHVEHRRRGAHLTQHRGLVAQHVDIGDRLTAIGEHRRHAGERPPPIHGAARTNRASTHAAGRPDQREAAGQRRQHRPPRRSHHQIPTTRSTTKYPSPTECLPAVELEPLASPRIPCPTGTSDKPLERLDKEIKRRAEVVGVFPNLAALLRLAGSVLVETHDEWQAAVKR